MTDVHTLLDAHWLSNPLLVYGERKAGTTLVLNLLDGGSQLLAYPNEIKLKRFARSRWPHARAMVTDYLQRNPDHMKDPFASGLSRVDPSLAVLGSLPYEEARELLNVDQYIQSLLLIGQRGFDGGVGQLIAEDMGLFHDCLKKKPTDLKMWALKEVGGDVRTILPFFHSLFPQGRVVVVVRDPRYIVRSIIRNRKRRSIPMGRLKLVRHTLDAMRKTQYYSSLLEDQSIGFIVYESIIAGQLEREMRNVCRFLDLSFDGAFLTPTNLGRSVVVNTSTESKAEVYNTQAVAWTEGLTTLEVSLIRMVRGAYRFSLRLRGKKPLIYADLISAIAAAREKRGIA